MPYLGEGTELGYDGSGIDGLIGFGVYCTLAFGLLELELGGVLFGHVAVGVVGNAVGGGEHPSLEVFCAVGVDEAVAGGVGVAAGEAKTYGSFTGHCLAVEIVSFGNLVRRIVADVLYAGEVSGEVLDDAHTATKIVLVRVNIGFRTGFINFAVENDVCRVLLTAEVEFVVRGAPAFAGVDKGPADGFAILEGCPCRIAVLTVNPPAAGLMINAYGSLSGQAVAPLVYNFVALFCPVVALLVPFDDAGLVGIIGVFSATEGEPYVAVPVTCNFKAVAETVCAVEFGGSDFLNEVGVGVVAVPCVDAQIFVLAGCCDVAGNDFAADSLDVAETESAALDDIAAFEEAELVAGLCVEHDDVGILVDSVDFAVLVAEVAELACVITLRGLVALGL